MIMCSHLIWILVDLHGMQIIEIPILSVHLKGMDIPFLILLCKVINLVFLVGVLAGDLLNEATYSNLHGYSPMYSPIMLHIDHD